MEYYNYFIYFLIFFSGACFGSFNSVVIHRLVSEEENHDIVLKRSHCPKCSHKLGVFDLIPVVSYIIRRGKCHYCKSQISILYLLLELFQGLIFIICYYRFGLTIEGILIMVMSIFFVSASIIDIRYMIIPLSLNITILILCLILAGINKVIWPNIILASSIVIVFLLLSNYFYSKKGRHIIGGADLILFFSFCLVVGVTYVNLLFLLSGLIGILSFLLCKKNKYRVFPFGPAIMISFMLIMFLEETKLFQIFAL